MSPPASNVDVADVSADEAWRYAAFISYRHTPEDRRWAKWLHSRLETYALPKHLRHQLGLPAKLGRCFRDEEELAASSSLSRDIDEALRQSRFLIVVCSPHTPASEWVNREVERFRELGRHNRILALLTDGEPRDSFPQALREIRRAVVDGQGLTRHEIETVEPLAADVRPIKGEWRSHTARFAKLRLIAQMLGIRFDDLRQREQERKVHRLMLAGGVLVVLLTLVTGLAAMALLQRNEAVHQTHVAAQNLSRARTEEMKAKVQLGFLNEVLASPNPRGEKGASVTVREAIDVAATRVEKQLGSLPESRAAIEETLGRTYSGIGIYSDAEKHLRAAMELDATLYGPSSIEVANVMLYLGYALAHESREGAAQEAMKMITDAVRIRREVLGVDKAIHTLVEQGKFAAFQGVFSVDSADEILLKNMSKLAGDISVQELLAEDLQVTLVVVRQRCAVADMKGAKEAVYEAIKVFLTEPEIKKILPSLMTDFAYYLFSKKDYEAAEPIFREALDCSQEWHGKVSPEAAHILNLLGTFEREARRNFVEAEKDIREARKLAVNSAGEGHPDTVMITMNLARTLHQVGKHAEAERLYRGALADYRELRDQRNETWASWCLADTLVDEAKFGEAEPLAAAAMAQADRAQSGDGLVTRVQASALLARLYTRWNKPQLAAKYVVAPPASVPRQLPATKP